MSQILTMGDDSILDNSGLYDKKTSYDYIINLKPMGALWESSLPTTYIYIYIYMGSQAFPLHVYISLIYIYGRY